MSIAELAKSCIVCGVSLTESNTIPYHIRDHYYICRDCFHIRSRKHCHEYWLRIRSDPSEIERRRARGIEQRNRTRLTVFSHYCGGLPRCQSCGVVDLRVLTVDHIEGGGTRHRRKIHRSNFYKWLLDAGFPDGYQILCMNCQWIKRAEKREFHTEYRPREITEGRQLTLSRSRHDCR